MKTKRAVTILLSISMVVGMMPSLAFAAENNGGASASATAATITTTPTTTTTATTTIKTAEAETLEAGDFEQIEAFRGDYEDSDTSRLSGDSLPSSLDLRDRGVVTPVKFQNPFGTCWAFGSMAAAETSILSELGTTYEEFPLDLSEKHLAWFAMTALDDPTSSQNGEGFHYIEEESSGHMFQYGGWEFYAAGLFAQGVGPTLEEYYPYMGANGKTQKKFDENDDIYDYCYSADDDWSIAESARFTSEYLLEHGYMFPSTVEKDDDGNVVGYDYDLLNTIKEELNAGRGVGISYCADVSAPDEEGNQTYINAENWCQYTDEPLEANHMVCIVGYDDNYSKENFNEAHQPEKDGAFLVKNSWGSGEEEFPNKGKGNWGIVEDGVNTGYFWLSYYDQTICTLASYDFDVNSDCDNSKLVTDQYDFAGYDSVNVFEAAKDCSMANVYTARYNQELREVGIVSSTPGTEAYCEVYLVDENEEGYEIGELVSEATETCAYGGFHRITLDTPVKLSKGQTYMVAVTETNPDDANEVTIPILEKNKDTAIDSNSNLYAETVVNEGESYICYDGEWYDWTDVSQLFNPRYNSGIDADNLSIKAYSVRTSGNAGVKITKLTRGKKSFKATWKKAAKAAGYRLQYSTTSDFSRDTKTVTIKGASNTAKTVKGLKSGKKYYVRVRSYKKVNGKTKYSAWSDVKQI